MYITHSYLIMAFRSFAIGRDCGPAKARLSFAEVVRAASTGNRTVAARPRSGAAYVLRDDEGFTLGYKSLRLFT